MGSNFPWTLRTPTASRWFILFCQKCSVCFLSSISVRAQRGTEMSSWWLNGRRRRSTDVFLQFARHSYSNCQAASSSSWRRNELRTEPWQNSLMNLQSQRAVESVIAPYGRRAAVNTGDILVSTKSLTAQKVQHISGSLWNPISHNNDHHQHHDGFQYYLVSDHKIQSLQVKHQSSAH